MWRHNELGQLFFQLVCLRCVLVIGRAFTSRSRGWLKGWCHVQVMQSPIQSFSYEWETDRRITEQLRYGSYAYGTAGISIFFWQKLYRYSTVTVRYIFHNSLRRSYQIRHLYSLQLVAKWRHFVKQSMMAVVFLARFHVR